jgi:hypothetical protein
VAAECEVDDCGVLAIGRCAQCGRAMCESHRALGSNDTPVINQCAPCQRATAEANFAKRNSERDRLLAASKAVRDLTSRLAAAEVPGEKVYHAEKWRKTPFGGSRRVEDPIRHKYGWFVGEHEWTFYNEGQREARFRTFITEDGRFAGGGFGIVGDVSPLAETEFISWTPGKCPSMLDRPGPWQATFMESVLQELKKLARQHGIDPESAS